MGSGRILSGGWENGGRGLAAPFDQGGNSLACFAGGSKNLGMKGLSPGKGFLSTFISSLTSPFFGEG